MFSRRPIKPVRRIGDTIRRVIVLASIKACCSTKQYSPVRVQRDYYTREDDNFLLAKVEFLLEITRCNRPVEHVGSLSTSGYLKHGQPDTRDDISTGSTRLGSGIRVHAEYVADSSEYTGNVSQIMEDTESGGPQHGTNRIKLHLRCANRHANSLSYCTPRRISRRPINILAVNQQLAMGLIHIENAQTI